MLNESLGALGISHCNSGRPPDERLRCGILYLGGSLGVGDETVVEGGGCPGLAVVF